MGVIEGSAPMPAGLRPVDRAERTARLRALLDTDQALVLPGATDALGARLIEQAGFAACYASGAGVANTQWAWPDIGLVGLPDAVEQVARIARATDLPVVADADDGYGGPLAVIRAVNAFQDAGAAAIQLEDQASPKRCGHFDGQVLIDDEDMVGKILATRRALRDGTVLIARTDARGVEGFDRAVQRARLYHKAGAEVLFVEACRTIEELRELPARLPGVPLLANIVEGGKTPELSAAELGDLGYRIVLFANFLLRSMVLAGQEALAELAARGTSRDLSARLLPWEQRQELVELTSYEALETELRHQARKLREEEGPDGR